MKLGYIQLPGRGETDRFLADLAEHLLARGTRLVGAVQTNVERACTHHCDMDLRILPDGPVMRISQDLGSEATGCRLDSGALETAVAAVAARMIGAEVLIVNKFGKHEAEGRGFRHLMAEALAAGLPVVVGTNGLNHAAFQAYAEGLAWPLPADVGRILAWLSTTEEMAAE
ncbi:MAG: DUF2478 domain-containing protein [Rhodobacteraceae bacterium]|nr:DUF2478 domain-containing protein [Paracoccaceae bacterium]